MSGRPCTLDDDDSVSMMDVIAEESRIHEDASAVLGGSDDQKCTFSEGYVNRQALYACSTCETTGPAGICLACSYHCHEGHDLYELYTKRNFRCDCGNGKFKETRCKLDPTKTGTNEDNQYNQNFKGVYCTCARPYPDPEDETEDDMIQCVVCEDWHHGRHLGTSIPEHDAYQEMICKGCMTKHSFLWAYQVTSAVTAVQEETGEEKVDVTGGSTQTVKEENHNPSHHQSTSSSESQAQVKESDVDPGKAESTEKTKRKADQGAETSDNSSNDTCEPASKRLKTDGESPGEASSQCLLLDLQKRKFCVKDCAAFWQEGWRDKLCSCSACLDVYKAHGVAYLGDAADTVSAYEEKGRSRAQGTSAIEQEQNILAGMDRVQQIEMINGFNDLKTELSDFLKSFAETGKVVTSEDIKGFFAHMEKRKKERMSSLASMQYSCK